MNNKNNYFYKYMKYKRKYLKIAKQLTGGWGKFDISISGQTTQNNKYKSARIIYHKDKYIISINLDVRILGISSLTYPIVLQDGKVYTISKKNNNNVITFKYKDDDNEKVLEFIVNNSLRKRFSINHGNQRLNIM